MTFETGNLKIFTRISTTPDVHMVSKSREFMRYSHELDAGK